MGRGCCLAGLVGQREGHSEGCRLWGRWGTARLQACVRAHPGHAAASPPPPPAPRSEFQTPDEEMKKIVLKVVKQCVATDGVEPDYIRTEVGGDRKSVV